MCAAGWRRIKPDLLFLQEIKCEAPAFPAGGFEALGYRCAVVGQKAYNGVAVLARVPFEVTHRALPGLAAEDAAQARYIEVVAGGDHAASASICRTAIPAARPGFAYKLRWMEALRARAAALLAEDTPLVIAGDFNVCPTDEDFAPGALPPTDALVRPESRARFRSLLWLGLTDAVRALHPTGPVYTFWDYQAGGVAARHGAADRPRAAVARAWPNGWSRRRRTGGSAARKRRRTTCRWWWGSEGAGRAVLSAEGDCSMRIFVPTSRKDGGHPFLASPRARKRWQPAFYCKSRLPGFR